VPIALELQQEHSPFENTPSPAELFDLTLQQESLVTQLAEKFPDSQLAPFLHTVVLSLINENEGQALQNLRQMTRKKYNDCQDMRDPETVTSQTLDFLKQQIISYLGEHALNRHFMYSQYLSQNERIVSPFQSTSQPFTKERLIDLLSQSRDYLITKFGRMPNAQELDWLDENFLAVFDQIFSEEFMQTAQGLELAELIGLKRLEQLLSQAEEGDSILLFSPYSPLRATPLHYNVTMIGEVRVQDDQKTLEMTYIRDTRESASYYQQYINASPHSHLPQSAQEVVADPILIIGKNKHQLFQELKIFEDLEIVYLFDQTINLHQDEIDQLVANMTSGQYSPAQIASQRERLEIKVVNAHRQLVTNLKSSKQLSQRKLDILDSIQAGYRMGSLCGSNSMETEPGKEAAGRGNCSKCGDNMPVDSQGKCIYCDITCTNIVWGY
jgi:hypothetical protein